MCIGTKLGLVRVRMLDGVNDVTTPARPLLALQAVGWEVNNSKLGSPVCNGDRREMADFCCTRRCSRNISCLNYTDEGEAGEDWCAQFPTINTTEWFIKPYDTCSDGNLTCFPNVTSICWKFAQLLIYFDI